jgi:hypothetical protein
MRRHAAPCSQAVCQALIKHGQQTLPELLRATRLPGATLRAALLALLQHNLAEAFLLRPEPGLRAAPPAQHIYEANAGSIAQWLRCGAADLLAAAACTQQHGGQRRGHT